MINRPHPLTLSPLAALKFEFRIPSVKADWELLSLFRIVWVAFAAEAVGRSEHKALAYYDTGAN